MTTDQSPKAMRWFLILVFLISFGLAGAYYLIFPNRDRTSYTILAVLYMFMPFVAALIVDKAILKRKNLKSWALNFTPNWWYLAAWPGVVLFSVLVLAVNTLWPGIDFTPDMSGFWERMSSQVSAEQIEAQKLQMEALPVPVWLVTIAQSLVAGITINAVAAFGEESGWRGFMVRE